nr:MAG TPA: hypothetical protein [Caudoviricetes sp.]
MNTRQIPGRDKIGSLAPGKYKTFEGTEISIENCLKAKVKDLRVEGKTYQNLFKAELSQGHVGNSSTTYDFRVNSEGFLLEEKTYTLYINTNYQLLLYYDYVNTGSSYVSWTDKIVWTNSTKTNNIRIMVKKTDNSEITVDEVIGKIVLLEGDYTNIDLPNSINGIESVTERENVNLLKDIKWYDGWINIDTGIIQTSAASYPNAKYSDLIDIDNSILYITNLSQSSATIRLRAYKEDGKTYMNKGINTFKELYEKNKVIKQDISKIRILILDSKKTPLPSEPYLIQDGEDINNPYPLKLKINDIITPLNLPIPLRSLPNGVADTIEGNKLVQRVGKVVLDGTENWALRVTNDDYLVYNCGGLNILKTSTDYGRSSQKMICEQFAPSNISSMNSTAITKEGICLRESGTGFILSISKNKLDTQNLAGFKSYLQSNPVTVTYELDSQIIHSLEIPSISTTKGANIVTTENNIKPKLSMKVKVKK